MEEMYQDPEKVVHQLRLLLASKEEELTNMRSRMDSDAPQSNSDSVTEELIKELESKKFEISDLENKAKETRSQFREKLSGLLEELAERDKLIATLKEQSSQPGSLRISSGETEELQAARSEIGKLQEELAEVKAAADDQERAQAEVEQIRKELEKVKYEQAQTELLKHEMAAARSTMSDLQATADDEEKAQSEAEQLRRRLEDYDGKLQATQRHYEEHISRLKLDVEELTKERDRILAELSERPIVDEVALRSSIMEEVEQESSQLLETSNMEKEGYANRIRELQGRVSSMEEDLDKTDRLYRTAQARLHKLARSQTILRGACGVLGLCLSMFIAISVKKPAAPKAAEVAAAPAPNQLAQSTISPKTGHKARAEETNVEVAEDEIFLLAAETPGNGSGDTSGNREKSMDRAGGGPDRIPYKVRKGDNLWLICKRELGDPAATKQVAADNNLTNPGALKVGDVIYISKR
jgi:DNA repair exonuclease SbcCD ATPase subunit